MTAKNKTFVQHQLVIQAAVNGSNKFADEPIFFDADDSHNSNNLNALQEHIQDISIQGWCPHKVFRIVARETIIEVREENVTSKQHVENKERAGHHDSGDSRAA